MEGKVSLYEVQVYLRGKQVIWTNFDYRVGQNFVGRNFRRATSRWAKFSSLLKRFVTFARQRFAR